MERTEWLDQMGDMAEELYDHFSPLYNVKYGKIIFETHQEYLQKFLKRVSPPGRVLSAACGAGKYDGLLLQAGHSVVGTDQSDGMLARAVRRFPRVRYEKVGLQELDFRNEFDGVICIDAMEHICPEDWPGILDNLRQALKPGGVLYFTADLGGEYVQESYERAKSLGLPVVFGEVADRVEELTSFFMSFGDVFEIPEDKLGELADRAVYHYCPPLDQIRTWVEQAGMVIEEHKTGDEYEHFLARKL